MLGTVLAYNTGNSAGHSAGIQLPGAVLGTMLGTVLAYSAGHSAGYSGGVQGWVEC